MAAPPGGSRNINKYPPWKHDPSITGLTPLPVLIPNPRVEAAEYVRRKEIEAFQRHILSGFTARELADMDVITDRALPQSNLTNPVIPLLWRNRWEQTPSQPQFTRDHFYQVNSQGQNLGEWTMRNDLVWDMMQPVLQLASRILMSVHVLPWFGSLIDGNRLRIDELRIHPDDIDDAGELECFHTRLWPNINAVMDRRNQVFAELVSKWNLTYGFMNPNEDPRGAEVDGDSDERQADLYGLCVANTEQMRYTQDPNKQWGQWIFLNYELVEPLFRNDLTSAERLANEWIMANTIVHETMHAVAAILPQPQQEPREDEPYHESEALAEVGHSFEAAINGGTTNPLVKLDHSTWGFPMGYWFESIWPTLGDYNLCGANSVMLINPEPIDHQISYPIPATFYSDIQREDFWTLVLQFGHKVFHYRNLDRGTRTQFTRGKRDRNKVSSVRDRPTTLVFASHLRNYLDWQHSPTATLEQRQAAGIAAQILQSSTQENVFWMDSDRQRKVTETLLDQIQGPYMGDTLVNLLTDMVSNHLIMAENLMNRPVNTTHTDRRRNLLRWNRGAQIFINDCGGAGLTPVQMRQVDEEAIALEVCRMTMWVPQSAEVINNGPDAEEYGIITQLSTFDSQQTPDYYPYHDLCLQVLSAPGFSLSAKLIARTLDNYLIRVVSDGRQQRFTRARKDHVLLQRLVKDAPRHWVSVLSGWEGSALRYINALSQEYTDLVFEQI